jgi:hypothetical protein
MKRSADLSLAAAFVECDKAHGLRAKHIEQISEQLGSRISRDTHYKVRQTVRPLEEQFSSYLKVYRSRLAVNISQRPGQGDNDRPANQARRTEAIERLIAAYHRSSSDISIAEQISTADNATKCKTVLRQFQRSRANMLDLESAMEIVNDRSKLARFASIVCKLIAESWSNGDITLGVAPVVLGKFGESL